MSYKDNDPTVMRNYANSVYFSDVAVLAATGFKGYSLSSSMMALLNKVTDAELKTQFTKDNTKALKSIRGVEDRISSGLFGCSLLAQATTKDKLGNGALRQIGDTSRRAKSAWVATSLDALNVYEDELKRNIETLINRSL